MSIMWDALRGSSRRRRGQFFIGVALILLSLMAVLFASSVKASEPSVIGSAAHSALIEAETVRAVRSALANASNSTDISTNFNDALLRTYLDRVAASEGGVFEDFTITESASGGNGTVSASVLVNVETTHASWNLSIAVHVEQKILSMVVAKGTSPQFESITITMMLLLNGEPDKLASALLVLSSGQNVACNVAARYSDGTTVLQAQAPTGWSSLQLVVYDVNGIKTVSSLLHPG
jgi:hypothetical protein